MEFFSEYKFIFLALHLLAMALGLGGATISDIMFFRFLRDLKISHFESSVLKTLSMIIWVGLGLAYISGIGLFLADPERLLESSKFLLKILVVLVITINGLFLNFYISPKLMKISFGKRHKHRDGELHYERKLAFAMGAISITSWYSAFVLGMMRGLPYSFLELLAGYLGLLLIAVWGGLVFEKVYNNR
ncbi:MAG: hypothetical protein COV57_01380 [Candidatus Liptonbacteria bacterium CG11_big_fil_rev_8_21_14_0_20_35_14]|uniref:DUF2269 domain-containing protein n=1 Tax=Candidatus Liptonbacteria bacterium CG11_big_fil_rev_8_21_14_0_20_35_14 TaxID=1974634 RepID=A0A2H0N802_9BACT|nr:MAG: hypothetical protein COV57_01380 [Candidatus Liptonbacteria bacterium CG11_big_fil_rev_8_21_14_0_20_35_14]